MYYDFSKYLKVCKRDLSDQEITEIFDLIKSKRHLNNELYQFINLGYTKFINKLDSKDLVKIGKIMISRGKINMELFKKIKLKGPNQVVWIIKNKLYPLLNLNNFSKKTWIESKDSIVRNIHKILPYIDKKTFDIIEPIIEWALTVNQNQQISCYKTS